MIRRMKLFDGGRLTEIGLYFGGIETYSRVCLA